MKEPLQEDNFENFLRGKLNEFDDEPQMEMWNRIESVIPPAPKPALYRYITTASIAASLLFTIVVAAGVHQYRSNQKLNQQLIDASEKIKTLEEEIGLETTTATKIVAIDSLDAKINASSDVLKKAENPKNRENHALIKNNSEFQPRQKENTQPLAEGSKKSKASKSDIIDNQATNNFSNTGKTILERTKQPEKNTPVFPEKSNLNTANPPMANNGSLTPQKNEAAPLSPKEAANEIMPDFIQTLGFESLANGNKINHLDSLNVSTPNFKSNGWVVAVLAQPLVTHTSFRTKKGGGKPNPDFSKHDIKPAFGWAATANVGYQVNKNWSFFAGVAYQKEVAYLEFSEGLKYDKNFETDINNEQQNYEQNYEANSPFGNMGLNVRFSKDKSDNIPSETSFDVNIKGTFETTSLNIPLYAQYQTQKGRLKYGVKLGFSTQIILDKAFTTENLTCSENALKPIETKVNKQPKWEHKVSIDNLIGASIAYAVTPNVDLSIEPTALLSLSSPHSTDKGSLSRVSGGLQMGVRYAF